ncbi:MAG: hypothetical protein ACOC5T_05175 [Elusimicrobiota bacterium]
MKMRKKKRIAEEVIYLLEKEGFLKETENLDMITVTLSTRELDYPMDIDNNLKVNISIDYE